MSKENRTNTSARIHEHAGRVAINVGGVTRYMSTELADAVAKELALAANQIKDGNHCPTTNIESCFDCGSTINGHHTPYCDFADETDKRDLPQRPGMQYWTAEKKDGEYVFLTDTQIQEELDKRMNNGNA